MLFGNHQLGEDSHLRWMTPPLSYLPHRLTNWLASQWTYQIRAIWYFWPYCFEATSLWHTRERHQILKQASPSIRIWAELTPIIIHGFDISEMERSFASSSQTPLTLPTEWINCKEALNWETTAAQYCGKFKSANGFSSDELRLDSVFTFYFF